MEFNNELDIQFIYDNYILFNYQTNPTLPSSIFPDFTVFYPTVLYVLLYLGIYLFCYKIYIYERKDKKNYNKINLQQGYGNENLLLKF